MLIMATINHRQTKRCHIDNDLTYSFPKKLKRLCDYHEQQQQLIPCDWSLERRKKFKRTSEKEENEEQQQYNCQVYLKLFSSTLKCSIEVIIGPKNKSVDDNNESDSILIAKTRISKSIRPGVIRVRLVSSLFTADADVQEDPTLTKYELIKSQSFDNHFDKQFALQLKSTQIGPGTIGKLFVESLDPSNGSYTNNSPIFELNLNLTSAHEILLTSSHQYFKKTDDDKLINTPLQCGCVLSPNSSNLIISDKCNLKLSETKLIHRLSDPLRCLWKSIGRELFPCFSETDLNDITQRYFQSEGNHECTYQLLREWYIRDPFQANTRYLLTRLKLPFELIMIIHNDVIKPFSSFLN